MAQAPAGLGIGPAAKVLSSVRGRDNVIRTQVSLDDREYELAKREAEALGISVAEFVRRAVRQMLPPPSGPPWMRYAGMIESGDPNSSRSIDDVIYGAKD